jgi:predicted nucleic acid-binding protein
MSDRCFLDTNVLVYAYDKSDPHKQTVAHGLLLAGIREESSVVSAQVLGEFFSVVTRKIRQPMTADEARIAIAAVSVVPVQDVDLALVHRAIDAHKQYGLAYWDCLIVASAERSGCGVLYTEDLANGQAYFGVRVINPFVSADPDGAAAEG